tara:strand:- start:518 stop:736 length:219 start_codon:yes stop_codon:yes gene_type:complete
MPRKKKTADDGDATTIELPEVTDLLMGQSFATSEAVTASVAMEKIAAGWVLTQNDERLIVVACPHDVHEEEN